MLFRVALRTARRRTLVWAVLLGAFAASGIGAFETAYPHAADRVGLAQRLAGNPGLRTLIGRASDLHTGAQYTAWRYGLILAVLAGLYALLTMSMLTRGEEESGLREAVWAGAVRRGAPLSAAVGAVAAGCALIGVAVAVLMTGAGAPGGGAVLFGVDVAATGWVFVGVTALTAQAATTRRATSGLAGAVLGISYLVRSFADARHSLDGLIWVSPLGWFEKVDPFGDTGSAAVAVALPLVTGAVAVAAAVAIETRRDLGAGLIGSRPGPAASRRLRSPEALATRLYAATGLGWLVGMAASAAAVGWVAGSITTLAGGNKGASDVLSRAGRAGDLAGSYLALTFQFFAVGAIAVAMQAILDARREEATGQAEALLALPVSRSRWLGSRVLAGAAAAAVAALGAGVAAALAWGANGGHGTASLVGAGLNTLPVTLLFAGFTALLVAVVPRWATSLSYGVLGVLYLWNIVGVLLDAPSGALWISPFHHIAAVPARAADPLPIVVLTALGVALVAAALAAVRRRDLTTA